MMSNFVELLYRQLSISCLRFLVKYDILIIVIENIYSLLIRKSNREIPKLITRKERSFMAIRKKQEPDEYQTEKLQFPVNIKQRICGFGMKKKQFLPIWQN